MQSCTLLLFDNFKYLYTFVSKCMYVYLYIQVCIEILDICISIQLAIVCCSQRYHMVYGHCFGGETTTWRGHVYTFVFEMLRFCFSLEWLTTTDLKRFPHNVDVDDDDNDVYTSLQYDISISIFISHIDIYKIHKSKLIHMKCANQILLQVFFCIFIETWVSFYFSLLEVGVRFVVGFIYRKWSQFVSYYLCKLY